MVAITVILATVIGAIVLDFGNNAGESAPSASLDIDADASNDNVTIEHIGGDSLNTGETRILVDNGSTTLEYSADGDDTFAVGDTGTLNTSSPDANDALSALSPPGSGTIDITTGDQITVTVIDTDSQRQIYKTTVTA